LPGAGRWLRFESKYRARIRILRHVYEEVFYRIGPLLAGIHRIQSSFPIIPHLHTLEWDADEEDGLMDAMVFMHDGIKECIFSKSWEGDWPNLNIFIEALPLRVPRLTSLELAFYPSQSLVDPFMVLFQNLPHLTHIGIPAIEDLSRILLCLGRSSALQSLTSCFWEAGGIKTGISVTKSLNPGSFPALRNLDLCTSQYKSIFPFLRDHIFNQLHSVKLHSLQVENPNSVRTLFHHISQNCPKITTLVVTYSSSIDDDPLSEPSNEVLVTFEDFRGVLECKKIKHFSLYHPYSLNLSDSDVEEIVRAWPQLEVLQLNPNPPCHRILGNSVSVSTVLTLACQCPELKDLGLLFDLKHPNCVENLSKAILWNGMRLSFHLNVGTSRIELGDILGISMTLAKICTVPDLKITCSDLLDSEVQSRWSIVEDTAIQFAKMHVAAVKREDRIKDLEEEVQRLSRPVEIQVGNEGT